jgi:myosin heavy subunit
MNELGLSDEEQKCVFETIAAVLLLGELQFVSVATDASNQAIDGSAVEDKELLLRIAKLIQVKP